MRAIARHNDVWEGYRPKFRVYTKKAGRAREADALEQRAHAIKALRR